MDAHDHAQRLKTAWEKLDREINGTINENCVGGSCSIGGPKKTSNGGSGGSKVASASGVTRMSPWSRRKIEEENDDDNSDKDDGDKFDHQEMSKTPEDVKDHHDEWVHTGQEEHEDEWTQTELKENAVWEDPQNVDPIEYFETLHEPYEILIKARGEVKSPEEWYNEIQQEIISELDPEVPNIPPTEGGFSTEGPVATNNNGDSTDGPGFPNTSHIALR